ncbi:hypothetical protein WHT83_14885 [Aminobacter sp. P9b]|uniref:hypothetical protein n=1 Tax=Aminobacter sp. P9b TaxID=3133697 RepID=UPI003247AAA6
MADLDLQKFGDALESRLRELGYSYAQAEAKWPETDRAMLSRAINAKPLSAGNFLLVCQMAGLDPYAFLKGAKRRRVTLKGILKQTVTEVVSREASGAGR